MTPSIEVLFLHHKNDEVTRANFESYRAHGNRIHAICDADANGLPDATRIPVTGAPIPRGHRWWCADTPYLNFALLNPGELTATHYLLCEWDCHCRADLGSLLAPYLGNDITGPHLALPETEPGWSHFRSLDPGLPRAGIRPHAQILIKREALLAIAGRCRDDWELLRRTNNEARMGTLANLCGLRIDLFAPEICRHIRVFSVGFKNPKLIYHPVKYLLTDQHFSPPEQSARHTGKWALGAGNSRGTPLSLRRDGWVDEEGPYNTLYWRTFWRDAEQGGLELLDGQGKVHMRFAGPAPARGKWIGDRWKNTEWLVGSNWLERLAREADRT